MKRPRMAGITPRWIPLVVLLAAAAATALASPAVAGAATPPRAQLRHLICQRSLDPASRAVAITAVMRPVPRTTRLALRFQLLSRAGQASTFTPVTGGDLGSWISPANRTLGRRRGDVWILNKQVVNLAAPALYRFKVTFRWIGARRRVLRTVTEMSSRCQQPELRPDLTVRRIVPPSAAHPYRYGAVIANQGASGTGPFSVLFNPGSGQATSTVQVAGLAAGATTQVEFTGPLCTAGETPVVTIDPQGQLDESNRSNNSASLSCPAAASSSVQGGRRTAAR